MTAQGLKAKRKQEEKNYRFPDYMENKEHTLINFFQDIESDNRITTAHISLYVSLWKRWNELQPGQCLIIFSYEVMPVCKISSYSTYHKIIRQLNEYRYIKYTPSYNHYSGSMIEFNHK